MKRFLSLLLTLGLLAWLPGFHCLPGASFPSPLIAAAQAEEGEEAAQTLGREVVADASGVWQIVDQEIRCSDPVSGARLATLPIGELAVGLPFRFSLLSDGDRVQLCLASMDTRGEMRVSLQALALTSGGIQAVHRQDCTAELGEFYTPYGSCLQVDMISCDQGIALSVLDEQFDCHLLLFDPVSGDLKELGLLPFSVLTAICPMGTEWLLAGDSEEVDHALFLARLSPAEGDLGWTADLPVGIGASGFNYVFDPQSGFLYFTLVNAAWRVRPEAGAVPEPVAVFSGMPGEFAAGTLAGNRYCVQTEEGRLLSCDVSRGLTVPRLRVADATGSESVLTATGLFNASHPEVFLTVEVPDGGTAVFSEYDAVILPLGSETRQALFESGNLLDLSGSTILSAAAAGMPESLRQALSREESLAAFPLAVSSPCLTLNTTGFQELTGRETIPQDWEGLLELLAELSKTGALTGQDTWSMTEAGLTAEDFRQVTLIWLLRTAVLEAQRDEAGGVPKAEAFRERLTGLLHTWEGILWDQLGPSESPSEGSEERTPLVSEQLFEISPMHMEEGTACWPLSLLPGSEPLLPWQASVLMIRADASHAQMLLSWAETLWEQTDILTKMSLTPGMDEPVENPDYEEAVAYYENRIRGDEQALAFAQGEEAEMIEAELSQLRPFLEAYRENAFWRASAESIAAYRGLSLVPEECSFWETEDGAEKLSRYLAGEISAEELVIWLESLL